MTNELKHWQTKIFVGDKMDQPVVVYGESLAKLKTNASKWLFDNKPLKFGNASPDYELSRRVNYAYSDGTLRPAFQAIAQRKETLDEGWYYVEGSHPFHFAEPLEGFDAVVKHFIEQAMLPEKGPDYREIALVENRLQPHLIRTVRRERKELLVNDMLQRGWYILELEVELNEQYPHHVEHKVVFVLGHTEENAS